jgi:hypothetical protein
MRASIGTVANLVSCPENAATNAIGSSALRARLARMFRDARDQRVAVGTWQHGHGTAFAAASGEPLEQWRVTCGCQQPDASPIIHVPEYVSTHELYLQEFVNITYTTSTASDRREVVITMRDGRQISLAGSARIADLVRRYVRIQKSGHSQ